MSEVKKTHLHSPAVVTSFVRLNHAVLNAILLMTVTYGNSNFEMVCLLYRKLRRLARIPILDVIHQFIFFELHRLLL